MPSHTALLILSAFSLVAFVLFVTTSSSHNSSANLSTSSSSSSSLSPTAALAEMTDKTTSSSDAPRPTQSGASTFTDEVIGRGSTIARAVESDSVYRFPFVDTPSYESEALPSLHRHIRDASRLAFGMPELPALVSSTSASSAAVSLFETQYQKMECGAVVSNFCFWAGQPRYFRKGSKLFSSTGATRACNEAETKLRFHMVMSEPFDVSRKHRMPGGAAYEPNTLLLAAMCWELYGYHLFLCLLNSYGVLSQLRFPAIAPSSATPRPRVKVLLLKTWSGESALGSLTSWDEESNPSSSKTKRAASNPFWGWWRVLVDRPSDVILANALQPTCVPYGVVAGRAELTPSLQQKFRSEMLRRFGIPLSPLHTSEKGTPIRITVVDRKTKFQLKNSADIARQFNAAVTRALEASGKRGIHVVSAVVVFEELPSLAEQMRVASSTDILVGMHGNGLTWTAMMAPSHDRGTALVELWPSHVYNANYAHIAGRANVRRWSVVAGIADCPKRCPAAIEIPDSTAKEVAAFVVGGILFNGSSSSTSHRTYYAGDKEHVKFQAEYALKKKVKRLKKQES